MTKNLIACALIASATFVAVAADRQPAFIVEAPDRAAPTMQTRPAAVPSKIIPIEELPGEGPELCVLEVCERNVDRARPEL